MKRKIIAFIAILGSAMSMTGCQMASIPDMSEEDTELVAQYAANLILSYNENYDTGIATEAEIQKADEKRERQRRREEAAKAAEAAKEAESNPESSTGAQVDTTVTNAELGAFLGLEGVTIDYQSYEICDSYPHDGENDSFFAMDAGDGKQLLVLNFNIQNNSGADQDIDILYQYPLFRIGINGGENKNALTTLLLNDLSTFKDTVIAGEARSVVLVTEITSEEVQGDIQSLSLHVKVNDQNADIRLQ